MSAEAEQFITIIVGVLVGFWAHIPHCDAMKKKAWREGWISGSAYERERRAPAPTPGSANEVAK